MLLVPESIFKAAIERFGKERIKKLEELGELVVIRGRSE